MLVGPRTSVGFKYHLRVTKPRSPRPIEAEVVVSSLSVPFSPLLVLLLNIAERQEKPPSRFFLLLEAPPYPYAGGEMSKGRRGPI